MTDQLAALRAEVERMRDQAAAPIPYSDRDTAAVAVAATIAYQTVLDLIDKHAREGQ